MEGSDSGFGSVQIITGPESGYGRSKYIPYGTLLTAPVACNLVPGSQLIGNN
jgi:hypothetical protein